IFKQRTFVSRRGYSFQTFTPESAIFAALLNARTRGASADTQPQPEDAGQARLEKEQADKDRHESRWSDPAASPPPQNVARSKRHKLPMKKDSGKKRRTEGGSKPQASS
ncbi:hypothetical protein LINPERHAP2_LOCUS9589, partial [Linum perenne]